MAVVALAGLASLAGCRRHDPETVKKYIAKRIDKELDGINATADQRATVHQVRDRLFTVFQQNQAGRKAMVEEALQLFEGNDLTGARVEALRSEHKARTEAIHAEVLKGIQQIHAVLTPDQRRQVTAKIRKHLSRWQH
jgi:Spy/CpxP family protein refolding chaperone